MRLPSPLFGAFFLAQAFACASPPPEDDSEQEENWGTDGDDDDGMVDEARCEDDSDDANQPFGNHALAYTSGAILPSVDQGTMDDAVRRAYDAWKGKYLVEGCGTGRAFIRSDTSSSRQTVSEAQGYGMMIVAYMAGYDPDARRLFDALTRYVQDHPAAESANLMAWAQDNSCNNEAGAHSATDGDLDIAYALLLADKQWGSGGDIDYRTTARAVLSAIAVHTLHDGDGYTLLGSWVHPGGEYYDATRSSDFMPGHFDSFAEASGESVWSTLLDSSYDIIESVQTNHAPSTGLMPDFILSPLSGPRPAHGGFLENDTDGAYGYNACRNPWRLGVHYLTTGDERAKRQLERLNGWLEGASGGSPWNIKAGYALDGTPLREYASMAYTAPFAVGAMVDASRQAFLDAMWEVVSTQIDGVYYSDSIQVLSLIALSGNWWAPESAPCGG